jgi:hypothetical protein
MFEGGFGAEAREGWGMTRYLEYDRESNYREPGYKKGKEEKGQAEDRRTMKSTCGNY